MDHERDQDHKVDSPTASVQKQTVDYRWLLRATPMVVLLALFIVFAVQNAKPVQLEFLGWEFESRRIVLLVGAAVFGVAVWELFRFVRNRRRKKKDEAGL